MGIYSNQPSNFCQSVNQEVVVPERNGLVRPEEFEVSLEGSNFMMNRLSEQSQTKIMRRNRPLSSHA